MKFKEEEIMLKMDFEDLMKYDVDNIDLLHNADGKREVIPPRGMEEELIMLKIESWKNRPTENITVSPAHSYNDEQDENEDEDEEVNLTNLKPEEIVSQWRKHQYYTCLTRSMKKNAKNLAETCEGIAYCCFDLQQVLDCPCSNVGDVFYKRCLSCYNFVVNNTENAYCYLWDQCNGNRGVNEVASNLIRFARSKVAQGYKNIMAFCDGCYGQNKNRIVAAALSYIVQTTTIE